MANNRVIYATEQVAIKDNRKRATDVIQGWYPDLTLASGISAADGQVQFTTAVSGTWPINSQFKVDNEYIYFGAFVAADTVGALVRGDGGTTAAVHTAVVASLCGWEVPLGVQSASMSTAFNTEDVLQLGQLEPYEKIETLPEIEVTIERVLDGTKPLWLMCTDPQYTTLKGRTANFKSDVAFSIYPDTQDSATGTPDSVVTASGMYVSAVSYTLDAEGNFTESITLVGNDKTWTKTEGTPSGYFLTSDAYDAEVVGSGVQRSEDYSSALSTLPADIGAANHIQSISVSADIGRSEIYQLGQKAPYYRAVEFPLTVTTTFEVITSEGDGIEAVSTASNLVNRTIILRTLGGLTINLGTKNKISSVTLGGGDTGGGNLANTFEYTNANSLTITHAAAPNG